MFFLFKRFSTFSYFFIQLEQFQVSDRVKITRNQELERHLEEIKTFQNQVATDFSLLFAECGEVVKFVFSVQNGIFL